MDYEDFFERYPDVRSVPFVVDVQQLEDLSERQRLTSPLWHPQGQFSQLEWASLGIWQKREELLGRWSGSTNLASGPPSL